MVAWQSREDDLCNVSWQKSAAYCSMPLLMSFHDFLAVFWRVQTIVIKEATQVPQKVVGLSVNVTFADLYLIFILVGPLTIYKPYYILLCIVVIQKASGFRTNFYPISNESLETNIARNVCATEMHFSAPSYKKQEKKANNSRNNFITLCNVWITTWYQQLFK
jgi:hypothetical protein